MELLVGAAARAVQQVVHFADHLHDRILDTIVHHLYVVARGIIAHVSHAGHTLHFGRNGFEDGPQVLVSTFVATGHHAWSEACAKLSARHAHPEKVHALIL